MDAICGWDSSSEEEDEEERERAKKEEMERRQRDIEEHRMKQRRKDEIDNGPEKKQSRFQQVSLSNALEWGLVTIGDDNLREEYREMMPQVEKHFLGVKFQYQKEVEEITKFEDLKDFVFQRHQELRTMHATMDVNDEHNKLHQFLVQFTVKILKALTAVTKIGKVEEIEYSRSESIFEEYWTKAHKALLHSNRYKFRNIYALYEGWEKEKVDEAIEETQKQLFEVCKLEADDDIDDLVSEMVNVTMEEDNHIRETSPPPINRLFSKHSIDKLMQATEHMRTDSELHQFQPRFEEPKNGTLLEELDFSSDSDDEENGNMYMFKEITRILTDTQVNEINDEPMEVDENVRNNNHQHIEMKPIVFPPPIKKKKVKFVDFESPSNTMRIFCHPLDWYRDDGDDGVTLAYVDTSLREGWKFLKGKLEYPYQLIRHPHFRDRGYEKPPKRVYRISRDLAYFDLPPHCKGTFGSRIWYPSKISNVSSMVWGLQDIYTPDELSQCIGSGMVEILHAFRKCYSRECLSKDTRMSSALHRMVVTRTKSDRGANYDECKYRLMDRWINNKKYCGKISTCFVLSDWRLFSVDSSVFLNAELKVFPSQLGNVFFSALMKFLKELFSYDWIEIKTLVFAFGGHESFELQTICRFLVFVQKLLANRNVQIHWISNDWIERVPIDVVESSERTARRRADHASVKRLNSRVGQFVEQMRLKGMGNMHFYDISECSVSQVRRAPVDALEFTLCSYMQYFFEKCNVLLHTSFFQQQSRAFTSDYSKNELRIEYNKDKRLMQ